MQYKHVSIAVAGLAIASFALAGCSSGGSDDASAPAPSRTAAAEQSTPTPTASKPAAASGVVTVTSDQIVDDQMGHTVQADEIVRNFPWSSAQAGLADRDDNEQILVHVKVTAGDRFYSTMDCLPIRVQAHGSTETYTSQGTTSVIEDDMQAAGYPALESIDQGESGEGWCAYSVTNPTDVLDLEYHRNAAASNDGTQITEQDFFSVMTPS
ncbi:hypothetical protein [Curtobacterium oceanosedimentum]|uniref:hypothetical protein n=1 Tax=Curtobacterium oceanosedimentum TaxID=465820 RepID=UPI00339AABE1